MATLPLKASNNEHTPGFPLDGKNEIPRLFGIIQNVSIKGELSHTISTKLGTVKLCDYIHA